MEDADADHSIYKAAFKFNQWKCPHQPWAWKLYSCYVVFYLCKPTKRTEKTMLSAHANKIKMADTNEHREFSIKSPNVC